MQLFNLDGPSAFADRLAEDLDRPVARHESRMFPDGEFKIRPLVDPRGEDCYVVQSLHGGPHQTPHDKLCALLMFIATLRDHGAARVSAVVPYMAYARKDRRTKPFDPVGLRYVAQMFEAVGTAQLFVLEAHNPAALENAFRCATVHLPCHRLFDRVAAELAAGPVVVASPDPGGVKRVQLWREHLESKLRCPVGFAMVDKRRSAGTVSSTETVAGEVNGAHVLLLDDLIATGETLVRAARALRGAGAASVTACAAHGLFVECAATALGDGAIDKVVVSDGVPPFRVADDSPLAAKLQVASCVSQFALALRESHAAWGA